MKRLYSILIVIVALFVFAPLAVADPGTPWDKKIAGKGRFKVLSAFGGAAVLDKETGRVWEKSPGDTDGDNDVDNDDKTTWLSALIHCYTREVGGRKGWRLPTMEELMSLVDPNNPTGDPDLPLGHPFANVQSSFYWSATTNANGSNNAWVVDFSNVGNIGTGGKDSTLVFVWCVRGGQGIDGQ